MKHLALCGDASERDRRFRESSGLTDETLVESASWAIMRAFEKDVLPHVQCDNARCVFVCGSGNNAADALALARRMSILHWANTNIIISGKALSGAASSMLKAASSVGLEIISAKDNYAGAKKAIACADIIFDGITGTGMLGSLEGLCKDLASAINENEAATVVSIDVPSGISDEMPDGIPYAVEADFTITVPPIKSALYAPSARSFSGEIVEASGIFPEWEPSGESAFLVGIDDLRHFIGKIPRNAHKGMKGKVGICGGHSGMYGAALLATDAALHARSGTVTILAEDGDAAMLMQRTLEAMVKSPLEAKPESFDAILAGPGWGTGSERAEIFSTLLGSDVPLVLDAHALDLYSRSDKKRRKAPLVLTPHPGEFERLAGTAPADSLSAPMKFVKPFSESTGSIIVFKACTTWIFAPDGRTAVYDGYESALASGGSGDVLAGTIAAFLANGLDPFDAACGGVIAHGHAGKTARKRAGYFRIGELPPIIGELVAASEESA